MVGRIITVNCIHPHTQTLFIKMSFNTISSVCVCVSHVLSLCCQLKLCIVLAFHKCQEQSQIPRPAVLHKYGSHFFNPFRHKFFTQKVISRSIYNLKIDTIYMYDIPFDRSFLQLSNGIRHVMPSTDRKLELTAKASMAQPVPQPAVCCNG